MGMRIRLLQREEGEVGTPLLNKVRGFVFLGYKDL